MDPMGFDVNKHWGTHANLYLNESPQSVNELPLIAFCALGEAEKNQKTVWNMMIDDTCIICTLLFRKPLLLNKNILSVWWFQPSWKNISQIGNLPQIGVNIPPYLSYHHLVIIYQLFPLLRGFGVIFYFVPKLGSRLSFHHVVAEVLCAIALGSAWSRNVKVCDCASTNLQQNLPLQWVRVSSRRLTSKLFYQRATIREPVSTIKVLFNPGLLRQNAYQRARACWLPELFLNLKRACWLPELFLNLKRACWLPEFKNNSKTIQAINTPLLFGRHFASRAQGWTRPWWSNTSWWIQPI